MAFCWKPDLADDWPPGALPRILERLAAGLLSGASLLPLFPNKPDAGLVAGA